MATLRCKCGTVLRDDDPDFGMLLFSQRDFDVDMEAVVLRGRAKEVWQCRTCERLWIFWDVMGAIPTEYVKQPS